MHFGFALRDFLNDPQRPMHAQLQDVAEVVRTSTSLGFWGAYMTQHWMSHPTIWLEPLPVLARLAAENDALKLITGVVLLPLHNPVHMAEQVVTMDHISNGRFILGAGLGYREKELEAVGTTRRERVGRFEESIDLMKRLWSGEEVTFEGQHWRVHSGRLGLTPVQKPHPPIWIASQSAGAARRAASLGEGCLIAPQVGWQDLSALARSYWQALDEAGSSEKGILSVHRCISIAADRETAEREAREAAEASAAMYGGWDMQEPTMVDLRLSSERDIHDWAIAGSPEECAAVVQRCIEETRAGYIGFTFLNLPRDPSRRLEYLQFVSESLLSRFQ